jgi:hypothetical protein
MTFMSWYSRKHLVKLVRYEKTIDIWGLCVLEGLYGLLRKPKQDGQSVSTPAGLREEIMLRDVWCLASVCAWREPSRWTVSSVNLAWLRSRSLWILMFRSWKLLVFEPSATFPWIEPIALQMQKVIQRFQQAYLWRILYIMLQWKHDCCTLSSAVDCQIAACVLFRMFVFANRQVLAIVQPFFPDRIVSDSNSVIQRLDWKKWSAPQLLCNSSFHILCLKATLECMSFIFGTISYYHETDVKRLDRSDVSVDIPFRSGQRPMGSGQYCWAASSWPNARSRRISLVRSSGVGVSISCFSSVGHHL